MRKIFPHLLFACLLTAAGCAKGTDAATGRGSRPPGESDDPAPVPSAVDERSASSVPAAGTGLLDRVEVVIEETHGAALSQASPASPAGNAGEPGTTSVSIKVKVTSRQENPRIIVEPRRFQIETDTGQRIQARPSALKDPSIRPTYLKANASLSGWITFEVPRIARSILLRSDLRTPPLRIPVRLPSS